MRMRFRSIPVALSAALILAAALPNASAGLLSISDLDWFGDGAPLAFIAGGTVTRCRVQIEGSFHRQVLIKSPGGLMGHITGIRAVAGTCNSGANLTVLASTLPWHIAYGGFRGTLPNFSSVTFNFLGLAVRFDPAGGLPACLFSSEVGEPARFIANVSGGTITGLTADNTASIDLEDESFACSIGGDAEIEGTAAYENGAGGPLTIRLI